MGQAIGQLADSGGSSGVGQALVNSSPFLSALQNIGQGVGIAAQTPNMPVIGAAGVGTPGSVSPDGSMATDDSLGWFDRNSGKLDTLSPLMRDKAQDFLQDLNDQGMNANINEAYRSPQTQDAYYAQGRTTPGAIITNARGGQSNHNVGLAYDLGGLTDSQYDQAGQMAGDYGLGWGGNFKSLDDKDHFELANASDLRRGGYTFTPDVQQSDPSLLWRQGIQKIESGGRYDLVGAETNGDRPYGAYQIMGANIGPWSKEILGTELTPQQFLQNQDAQDKIFDAKFGSYVNQYGLEGAAQAWLGGPGSVGQTDRKDTLGTSVGSYGKQFMANIGQASGQMPQIAGASPQVNGLIGEMNTKTAAAQNPATGQTAQGQQTALTPTQRVMEGLFTSRGRGAPQLPQSQLPMQQAPIDTGAQDVATAAQNALNRVAQSTMTPTTTKQASIQSLRQQPKAQV